MKYKILPALCFMFAGAFIILGMFAWSMANWGWLITDILAIATLFIIGWKRLDDI